MPRRTYNPKKGRRRQTAPAWDHFDWLVSELRKLDADRNRHRYERRNR